MIANQGVMAADFGDAQWFKSSHSGDGVGQCLEVADTRASHQVVAVRDSKHPNGPALALPASTFAAFVKDVASGVYGI